MAGAEKLIAKILDDAQRDAESLWAEADQKRKALRDNTLRNIEQRKAEIDKAAAKTIAENEKRMAAIYDLEFRKQMLAAKQEVMQKARDLALQKLSALDDASYLALMKKRLLACAAAGPGAIAVAPNETRLNDAFIADVNAALAQTSGHSVTLLPERRDIQGGFIFISGGLEISVSLEALLDEAWQQAETDVASVLFN